MIMHDPPPYDPPFSRPKKGIFTPQIIVRKTAENPDVCGGSYLFCTSPTQEFSRYGRSRLMLDSAQSHFIKMSPLPEPEPAKTQIRTLQIDPD